MEEGVILNVGEPLKVEVVNFDSIRDNAVKMVVAAVAVTVVTKLVEKSMESIIAKRQMANLRKTNEAKIATEN